MKEWMKNYFVKKSLIIFIILGLLEIFVWNYKTFVINFTNSAKYQQQTFYSPDYTLSGLEKTNDKNTYRVMTSNPSVEIKLSRPVKTFYFDVKKTTWDGKEIDATVKCASDEFTEYRPYYKNMKIADFLESTKYGIVNYGGNARKMLFEIKVDAGTLVKIEEISVNKKIPFNISLVRLFGVWILTCALYIFIKYLKFDRAYNTTYKSHRYGTVAAVLFVLLFIFMIYHLYIGEYHWWDKTSGNQLTQQLVDAFENGQTSLLEEVPQEILNAENPYDFNERQIINVPYQWDRLLFNGKYYSYYGIGPVLFLFLPYHKITGYYFSAELFCLMCTMLGVFFIAVSFLRIVKRWLPQTPFRMAMLGMITTAISGQAAFNLVRTEFYEVSQSAEMCFLAMGVFCMLGSNIFTKEPIKLRNMCLSAVFMSLAVMSRPTAVLYALAMMVWVAYGFFQYRKEKNKKTFPIKYVCAAITPYIIFGILQMTYNYLRFQNPLEFGIKYSLTLNDFTQTEASLGMIMVALTNILFVFPKITSEFPFITGGTDTLGVSGYYFTTQLNPVIGVLQTTLPIYALGMIPKYMRNFERKKKIRLGLVWFLPGVIIPVFIAAVTWESGFALRYVNDIGWQLSAASFVLIFYAYNRIQNQTIRKWLFRVLLVSTIWCVLSHMAMAFTTSPINQSSHNMNGAEIYYRIKSLVEFWK